MEFRGKSVKQGVRLATGANQYHVGDIGSDTDWTAALQGCKVVVHLAARVHVMHDAASDPLAAFRAVNTAGTLNLARQAAQSGVGRFVFLSSIKVNGEETVSAVYRETDAPNPQDPYAISKWEAEQRLRQISAETGMEVVILRPPLIYGPGVKANFYQLLRLVDLGLPLPFSAINNRRSMIYLGNLVDALVTVVEHPSAAGKTYLLSDGADISTAGLVSAIASAMNKPDRSWPLPPGMLRLAGNMIGKAEEMARLTGSLQVDSGLIRRELGWSPPYTLEQGLSETAKWYRHHQEIRKTA